MPPHRKEDPGRIFPAGVRGRWTRDKWGAIDDAQPQQARPRRTSRLSKIAHLRRPYMRFDIAAGGSAAAMFRVENGGEKSYDDAMLASATRGQEVRVMAAKR